MVPSRSTMKCAHVPGSSCSSESGTSWANSDQAEIIVVDSV